MVRCQCGSDIIVPDEILNALPVQGPPPTQPRAAIGRLGIARTVDPADEHPLRYAGFEIWAVDVWSYFRIFVMVGLVFSVPYAAFRLVFASERPAGLWPLVLFALIHLGGALLQPLYSVWVYNLTSAWLGGVRVTFRRPVTVTSGTCVIARIVPLPAMKVGALAGLVAGATYVGFFMIVGVLLFGPNINPFGGGAREMGAMVALMVGLPLVASLAGALGGFGLSALYNLGARLWGGVRMHIV